MKSYVCRDEVYSYLMARGVNISAAIERGLSNRIIMGYQEEELGKHVVRVPVDLEKKLSKVGVKNFSQLCSSILEELYKELKGEGR